MASDKEVTFLPATWSDDAARDLLNIGTFAARDITIFRDRVCDGEWELWDIEVNEDRLGCVVWSVEYEGDEDITLVVNAAAAMPRAGLDLTAAVFGAMKVIARTMGARGLRCWTKREGMRRKLEQIGCERHYVMEYDLG